MNTNETKQTNTYALVDRWGEKIAQVAADFGTVGSAPNIDKEKTADYVLTEVAELLDQIRFIPEIPELSKVVADFSLKAATGQQKELAKKASDALAEIIRLNDLIALYLPTISIMGYAADELGVLH